MGYLTGSLRRVGDSVYPRPGQTISGAISYAVEQINKYHPLVNNHSLAFVVAETYGDESESIRNTATLWSHDNVSVYIGPQETCVHEARMASSFNLPMISYVSRWINCQLYCKCSLNWRRRPWSIDEIQGLAIPDVRFFGKEIIWSRIAESPPQAEQFVQLKTKLKEPKMQGCPDFSSPEAPFISSLYTLATQGTLALTITATTTAITKVST